ncbi:MAG: polynucleotide adenylyltransferase PcnB [Pseudomonadota bacterium]
MPQRSDPSDSAPTDYAQPIAPVVYPPSKHSIRKNDIDDDARKVVYRLQRAGFKAYIVGGGVRDILLGKRPKDFDISTDATPRQIKSLFRNCRIIGRRFKLAHVFFAHGKTLEVSTFRDTVEPPEVPDADGVAAPTPVVDDNLYGTEETDAIRRDLTINGLFLDVSTMEIIDYVDGMRDLESGTVRIIGDPDLRFAEDPVRMLRAVRHSARNGFHIERGCWDSILRNAELITSCSQVRVFDELKKDVNSGHFLTILSLLGETGLLEFILPELLENNSRLLSADSDLSVCLERIDDMAQNDTEISATTVLSLIALFTAGDSIWLRDLADWVPQASDLGERLSTAFTRLTVPRKERERIQMLLSLWGRVRSVAPKQLKAGSYKRSTLLKELISLIEITQFSREDAQRLQMLSALLHPEHHEHHDHQQKPTHVRRRP